VKRWEWLSVALVSGATSRCGARTELAVSASDAASDSASGSEAGACASLQASLQIPSESPWSDTGIDVVSGMTLSIEASGTVSYFGSNEKLTGPDGGNWDGQKFFADAVLPNTIVVSLIGKVGGSTALDTGTPLPEGTSGDGPGFVGSSYEGVVHASGRLFLGFNDQRPAYAFADNSGSFSVTITLHCGA